MRYLNEYEKYEFHISKQKLGQLLILNSKKILLKASVFKKQENSLSGGDQKY